MAKQKCVCVFKSGNNGKTLKLRNKHGIKHYLQVGVKLNMIPVFMVGVS